MITTAAHGYGTGNGDGGGGGNGNGVGNDSMGQVVSGTPYLFLLQAILYKE